MRAITAEPARTTARALMITRRPSGDSGRSPTRRRAATRPSSAPVLEALSPAARSERQGYPNETARYSSAADTIPSQLPLARHDRPCRQRATMIASPTTRSHRQVEDARLCTSVVRRVRLAWVAQFITAALETATSAREGRYTQGPASGGRRRCAQGVGPGPGTRARSERTAAAATATP